jgi:signal peptidase II
MGPGRLMTAPDGTTDGGDQLDHAALRSPIPVDLASRGRARWGIFLALAAAIVVVDQLTKAWLVGAVAPGEAIRVVGDYVRLVFGRNSGALFGLFGDSALLFGLISVAVVALIVVYHGRSPRSTYVSVALGLLLGGAIGNLVDRLRLGYVIDFVDVGIGTLRWYTFNVADAAISTAILLLVLMAVVPALAGDAGRSSDV